MGFNFKESFKNVSKAKIIILTVTLFIMAVCAVFGYEYYRMKQMQQEEMNTQTEQTSVLFKDAEGNIGTRPMKPSEYKVGMDYNLAIKEKKPIVVLFYADWCRFCIGFMPTYQSLSRIYADDYNFSKVNVEDLKYQKLVKEIGITGFPTVYLIDPKYDNKVLLSNSLFGDMKSMRVELDRFLRIRELLDRKN